MVESFNSNGVFLETLRKISNKKEGLKDTLLELTFSVFLLPFAFLR